MIFWIISAFVIFLGIKAYKSKKPNGRRSSDQSEYHHDSFHVTPSTSDFGDSSTNEKWSGHGGEFSGGGSSGDWGDSSGDSGGDSSGDSGGDSGGGRDSSSD
jgi:hypothetical protein